MKTPKGNRKEKETMRECFWKMYDTSVNGGPKARQIEIQGKQACKFVMNWEVAYWNFITGIKDRGKYGDVIDISNDKDSESEIKVLYIHENDSDDDYHASNSTNEPQEEGR
jgi:hypothetical protein